MPWAVCEAAVGNTMKSIHNFFASTMGIVVAGICIGAVAFALQYYGNPANMGLCVACFSRDAAGAIGLHRADVVQYLRPEIMGMVLGALVAALVFREFRPQGGSSPVTRFVLGIVAAFGALVFLGCPWRVILRLAGGDANALLGLLGLMAGVYIGTLFFRQGYSLGRSVSLPKAAGWAFPILMVGLTLLALLYPQIPGEPKSGVLFYSLKGPGSQHAPFVLAFGLALIVGFLAQRSRFCTMGAFRDIFLFRAGHLFWGLLALWSMVFALNIAFGTFKPGFENQPIAHTHHLWNFLGMLTAGLAFALAGGCPGRQLFAAGEGNNDAAVFAVGLLVGAALAHNFGIASTPAGIGPHGAIATLGGFVVCLAVGLTNCTRRTA